MAKQVNFPEDSKRPFGVMSLDTRLLLERLEKSELGDVITYSELSEIIHSDVQGKSRGLLMTARRSCLNKGIAFGAVVNVGLKRLTDSEIVATGEGIRRHIRRSSRKAVKTIQCAEFNALSNEEKIRHNTALSFFGALYSVTSPRSEQKLLAKVQEAQSKLSIKGAFQAILENSKEVN